MQTYERTGRACRTKEKSRKRERERERERERKKALGTRGVQRLLQITAVTNPRTNSAQRDGRTLDLSLLLSLSRLFPLSFSHP
jgi:hypothetical protein